MSLTEIDAALVAANPLSDAEAGVLALHAAEMEMIEEIVAVPRARHAARPAPARRRRWPLLPLSGLATAAAVVAFLLLLGGSGGRGDGPASAYGAALVRFAEATPLTLLELPGWHVVYADEEPGGVGEVHFVRGPAGAEGMPRGGSLRRERSLVGRLAQLTWNPLNAAARRALQHRHTDLTTGLGLPVRALIREGAGPGWVDETATILDGGRVLSFRATVSDMAAFAAELHGLRSVGTTTFLRAMPASVVRTANTGATVRLMLKGIPLPPGFDAARIRGAHLIHDRYQLGAAVTGTVACLWFADWNRARAAGDQTMVNRAVDAMATAPHWPILREMARQGAWTQVLVGYARHMRSGTWFGRPLIAQLDDGIGCRADGIDLGPGAVVRPHADTFG